MNLAPILREDNGRDGDRDQDSKRGSHVNRQKQRQQRNCDQRFAEAKCGANQRGKKDNNRISTVSLPTLSRYAHSGVNLDP